MSDFFAMGGYAAYVWPAYALAALVLVGLLVASLRGLHAREATLKALEGSRPVRRRSRREETAGPDGAPAGMGEG